MKRKIVSIALVLVLLMVSLPAFASSDVEDSNLEKVLQRVEITNALIKSEVEFAQELCERPGMTEEDIDKVIDTLVMVTNYQAQSTMKMAAALGITVECQYDLYIIGGREVLIDPLVVPGW